MGNSYGRAGWRLAVLHQIVPAVGVIDGGLSWRPKAQASRDSTWGTAGGRASEAAVRLSGQRAPGGRACISQPKLGPWKTNSLRTVSACPRSSLGTTWESLRSAAVRPHPRPSATGTMEGQTDVWTRTASPTCPGGLSVLLPRKCPDSTGRLSCRIAIRKNLLFLFGVLYLKREVDTLLSLLCCLCDQEIESEI